MTSATGIPPLQRSPLARPVGSAFAAAFAVAHRLRHPRPIHSRGVVLSGDMRWIPDATPAGVSFIDDAPPGPVPVIARVSRSLGLPAPFPDIIGVALRVDTAAWEDGTARGEGASRVATGHAASGSGAVARETITRATSGHGPSAIGNGPSGLGADRPVADIELASTGWSFPARFALLPHRRAERARLGTLLPYRGRRGAVLLGARTAVGRPPATDPRELAGAPDASWILTVGHATPAGPWHPFARLHLRLDADQDARALRFDAVRRPIPGAGSPAWVRAARQPSYVRIQPDGLPLRLPAAPPGERRAAQPAAAGT